MRALRDFNIPKIVTDDLPVFMGLIGDLFPAMDVPRKRDLDFEGDIRKAVLVRSTRVLFCFFIFFFIFYLCYCCLYLLSNVKNHFQFYWTVVQVVNNPDILFKHLLRCFSANALKLLTDSYKNPLWICCIACVRKKALVLPLALMRL